jgi:alkylhydroperoxidase family enzyme
MAFIHIIEPAKAKGGLKKEYEAAVKRASRVFNIIKSQSQNPKALHWSTGLYTVIMHGQSPLSRAQRKMLATGVSKTINCHY